MIPPIKLRKTKARSVAKEKCDNEAACGNGEISDVEIDASENQEDIVMENTVWLVRDLFCVIELVNAIANGDIG